MASRPGWKVAARIIPAQNTPFVESEPTCSSWTAEEARFPWLYRSGMGDEEAACNSRSTKRQRCRRRGRDWKRRSTSASSRAAGSGALPAASHPARVELSTSLSTIGHQPIYYCPPAYLLLSTSLSIKVQLWNEIVAQKVLPAEQARRDALAENSQSTA